MTHFFVSLPEHLSIAIALYRARTIMLERERGTEWVKEVLQQEGAK